VFQDVRGKYGSEGDYVMTRPVRGPLNNTPVDHSTDAYDTIDWLVKNVKESNGKVGMVGSPTKAYGADGAGRAAPGPEGRGADEPHGRRLARRRLVPQRRLPQHQPRLHRRPELGRAAGEHIVTGAYDDYDAFLRAGSTGDFAHLYGVDQLNFTKKIFEHPAYDSYWQEQALDRILAKKPLTVPTMTVVGRWDQEDIYGAYATCGGGAEGQGQPLNSLVVGPWRHSGVNYEGSRWAR
jgi:predicted acyl esterase